MTRQAVAIGSASAAAPTWRRMWRASPPVLLVLPTLLVVFLVIGIPLIYSLALSLHRINPLTQRWIFVGLANYAKVLPDPDFHRRIWPHRLFRCRHCGRRPRPRHGDGARAQHGVRRPRRAAQPGAGAVGDVAGRCRHPLELDAERRLRHLQCHPAFPRGDHRADPLARQRPACFALCRHRSCVESVPRDCRC